MTFTWTQTELVTETFTHTGAEQTWVVPAYVTGTVKVRLWGAGPEDPDTPTKVQSTDEIDIHPSRRGGYVEGTLEVTDGETLYIYVGGKGLSNGTGGFNGGGEGGSTDGEEAPGGGGASDIRQGGNTLSDRVVIAAGGAGGTVAYGVDPNASTSWHANAAPAGDGGADIGQSGSSAIDNDDDWIRGGGGGTQSSGGDGGLGFLENGSATDGNDGSLLDGGNGVARGSKIIDGAGWSGGGGAGLYGGGTGAAGTDSDDFGAAAGSGGGSNYDDGLLTTRPIINERGTGMDAAHGKIEIIYEKPIP